MTQRRHALGRNHGTEGPSNLLFFDCEAHHPEATKRAGQKAMRLRLWHAIALRLEGGQVTRRVEVNGMTSSEFWKFLYARCSLKNPLWAFCHNAACDWTWIDFWAELASKRLELGPIPRGVNPRTGKARQPWKGRLCLESRPCFAVARHEGATVKLVDTGNYWPESIWTIGQRYGLPKLDWPGFAAPDDVMLAYCRRDCEIVERAVLELLKWWLREDCGCFQMTAPQLALTNYRHTQTIKGACGQRVELVCEPDHPSHKMERRGYYGNRFEAFYVGRIDRPLYQVDVNSCYLAVMADNLFPVRRVGNLQDRTPEGLRKAMQCYAAVADVVIRSRDNTYPWRNAKDPLQLHCCGRFATTLCGPELLRALDAGDVEYVHKAQLYAHAYAFKGWAEKWHDRKVAAELADDAGMREFAKLIGNSLSGKWGQRGIGWKDRFDMSAGDETTKWVGRDPASGKITTFRSFARRVQEWVNESEPRHSMPILSAYICAYAREYMRWLMDQLPFGSCYYIGADGLLIDGRALVALRKIDMMHDTELGKLKIKQRGKHGEVKGTNCYRVGDVWTKSGTHARSRPGMFFAQASEVWERMPAILHRPFDGTVRVQEVQTRDIDPRPKGTITPSGWVLPLRLSPDRDFSDLAGMAAWVEACMGEHQ